jgi:ATP-binding cassette subfamily B protein IrtA
MSNKKGIWRLIELAGQEKGKLILSSFFSIISAACYLAPFIIIYFISIELFKPSIDKEYVWVLAWFGLAAGIFRFLFLYFSVVLSHIAAYNILYHLRREVAKHMGTLSMGFFSNRSSGALKKILNDDVEEIELFIAHHIPDIVTAVVLPLMTIGYLLFMDWRLALTALFPIPIAFFAQHLALHDAGELTMKYHRIYERMNSVIVEFVRGMSVIKIFNQTSQSFLKYKEGVNDFKQLCIDWTHKSIPPNAFFTTFISASLFFILPVGVWLFLKGSLNISTLILFLLLGIGYSTPLMRISMYSSIIGMIIGGVNRIDDIFAQPALSSAPTPAKLPENNNIEFRNVSFSYEDHQVLDKISFTALEGEITALVGPSGAGKSTAAKLIPRFWDISEGEILIGGVNIKEIPVEELMKRISFVFQDFFMFNDTIETNVKMGKNEAKAVDIQKAASLAQAHHFIEQLPEDYQTVFGSGGTHLSGGEKQRICLARAILKDAPIIILDEPTSFTDADNEFNIQQALSSLLSNKTCIIIAHRLSNIRNVNRIVVIDEGKIAGSGTHEELLEKCDLYKNMWDAHMNANNWQINTKTGEK